VSALRQEFLPARVELPLEVLFSTPTVEGIAQYIDRELAVERLAAQRKLLETEQTEIEEGDFE
jgi:hypothetical protein